MSNEVLQEISNETTEERSYFKYPEIENSYREAFITKIKEHGYGFVPYYVTEKIHGTNTQISYNYKTKEFSIGGRNGIFTEEKFYNAQTLLPTFYDKVEHAAEILANKVKNLEKIIIYGELFGGSYPHENVKKDNKAQKVQKGVFYSPHNEWKVFDIRYFNGEEYSKFLGGKDFFEVCNEAGLDTVPLLKVCDNLNEALSYPNNGQSVVYESYGLPKLEQDNIMEGVVIKAWNEDLYIGQHRVAIKNKNDKFSEKIHASKPKEEIILSDLANQAKEEISQYINENRVHNIISHIGEVTVSDIGKVIGLTSVDVLNDYKKDYDTLFKLEQSESKIITKFLQSEVAKVVRKVILECETFSET